MSNGFTVLRVDASARRERSLSRALADRFVREWRARWPDDALLCRDVGASPPPAVSEAWIGAAFTPTAERSPEQRCLLSLSDTLISELREADLLLIAAPMYNYGMPAALKAWVDQVVRVAETFTFDLRRGDWPLEPILKGKSLVLLTSSGEFGFAPGGPRADMDHLTPHLRTLSRYFGVGETYRVAIEYQEFGDERHRRSVVAAQAEVVRLVEELSERRLWSAA
jgi:FMN-dependent NADH-azoreductase